MKMLFLSNYHVNKDEDLKQYFKVFKPDEIEILNTANQAKNYVWKHLIREQKHLDLIIISNRPPADLFRDKTEDLMLKEFSKWIKDLNHNYSNNNFQIRATPLMLDQTYDYYNIQNYFTDFKKDNYEVSVDLASIDKKSHQFFVSKSINIWLNKLADDLDDMDLDTSFDFKKSKLIDKSSFNNKVLSQTFIDRRNKLDYLWIGNNIEKLYVDLDYLKLMLSQSEKNKHLRNEKEFHRFFLNYPRILLGDEFLNLEYEKQLYLQNSQSYIEIDFLKRQFPYSFKKPMALEIKLPNQKFGMPNRNQLYRNTIKGINQIGSKYFQYLTNPLYKDHIKQRYNLTQEHLDFDYSLLLGRSKDKEENEEIIRSYLNEKNFNIEIITYDDLISKYQFIYNRLQKFRLY